MNLKNWSAAAFALLMFTPVSASALGIEIVDVTSTGASTSLLDGGDVLTVTLRLENAGGEDVFGLGLGVDGYDPGLQGFIVDNRLIYESGAASTTAFAIGQFQGEAIFGIDNQLPGVVQLGEGGPGPFPLPSSLSLQLFNGINSNGANGDGTQDFGVNGGLTGPGDDVHFQVSFRAQELALPGDVTLNFGTVGGNNGAIGQGGALLGFNNASLTVTVVPEPGTALLMGLGLAGLAGIRRS